MLTGTGDGVVDTCGLATALGLGRARPATFGNAVAVEAAWFDCADAGNLEALRLKMAPNLLRFRTGFMFRGRGEWVPI